jgi:hypothetical protein
MSDKNGEALVNKELEGKRELKFYLFVSHNV